MDEKSKALLAKVAEDRLERALQTGKDEVERKHAFNEAMAVMDKQIELERLEVTHREHIEKQRNEEKWNRREDAFKREEAKKARNVQIAMFVAGLIVTPTIDVLRKTFFANHVAKLEEFDTFTSQAGKGISSWFRWKD